MTTPKVVFLFDVDNTLLDNDRVTVDLKRHLEQTVGHERQENYWVIFERLRTELGYADYLGALQRFRVEHPRDPQVLTVSHFLVNYPLLHVLHRIERIRKQSIRKWIVHQKMRDRQYLWIAWMLDPKALERSQVVGIPEFRS